MKLLYLYYGHKKEKYTLRNKIVKMEKFAFNSKLEKCVFHLTFWRKKCIIIILNKGC